MNGGQPAGQVALRRLVRGVDDGDGAIRTVGNRIGHAAQDTSRALHSTITHNDEVCLDFVRNREDDVGGIADRVVQNWFDAIVLGNEGQDLQQGLRLAIGVHVLELGGQ